MNSKIIIFFILVLSSNIMGCELTKKTVSFSGPMTMLIEEMNLLEDPKLRAISTFHPISKKTTAKVLAGGLFLSKKTFSDLTGSLIFYDKSREFKKLLNNSNLKEIVEIDTLKKDVFETLDLNVHHLKKITKGCEKRINKLNQKVIKLKEKIARLSTKLKVIFYLGKFDSKLPELIIVNDGIVLTLLKANVLSTYESDLSYVNWSQKELKKYKTYLHIGISESKKREMKIEKFKKNYWNLSFKGSLTPGVRQFYFLERFLNLTF